MNWIQLLNAQRFGLDNYASDIQDNRTEFQRDYDRILFSAAFRRLQDKTQVFPFPSRNYVHNRLTHSLEVASVGRSLGDMVVKKMAEQKHPDIELLYSIGSVVAAACLLHDLGNPPFGHSGEQVLSSYFSSGAGKTLESQFNPHQWSDLCNFEGNANALRLMTHAFKDKRQGGYVLTYATLASTMKYPNLSIHKGTGKYGYFASEHDTAIQIAKKTGLISKSESYGSFCRHPLVYLVEAADDICYQIIDIEDSHRRGILSFDEVQSLYLGFFEEGENQAHLRRTMQRVPDKNEQIAYLRTRSIGELVHSCVALFVENEMDILNGNYQGSLTKNLPDLLKTNYKKCASVAFEKIYNAPQVVEVEIAGHKILTTLLATFSDALLTPTNGYSRKLLSLIPAQFEVKEGELYDRYRNLIDYISGMTDLYALDLYRKITGITIPGFDGA